jgi:tripartite-type tricarboxylate transporter receptor subunit TctC
VRREAPWKSWKEFAEDASRRPGSSPSVRPAPVQTPSIVLSELVQSTGLQANRVPYKRLEQASDLLGGHIDAGVLSA